MKAILSDVCIEKQVDILVAIMTGSIWVDLWARMGLQHRRFRDVGLAAEAPDTTVWDFCQREQMALITANRNDDGPDSLAAAIRTRNTLDAIPVFTIANADRILHSNAYAEYVVEELLDRLLDIDNLRGTGRVWLP